MIVHAARKGDGEVDFEDFMELMRINKLFGD